MPSNHNKDASQNRKQQRQQQCQPKQKAGDISVDFNAAARLDSLVGGRSRRLVTGVTIDDPRARLLDDGISLTHRRDGGWMIEASIADLPAMIPNNHAMEQFARRRQEGFGAKNPLFHYGFLLNYISLQQGHKRAAVTFRFELDSDLNLKSCDIERTVFQNTRQCTDFDIAKALADKNPDVEKCIDLGRRLFEKRTNQMGENCDRIVANDNAGPESAPTFRNTRGHEGEELVHEIMRMTNLAAAQYLRDHNLTAPYKPSIGCYDVVRVTDDFAFDQDCNRLTLEVIEEISKSAPPYAKLTSPMQKYRDFLTLKLLTRHMDGEPIHPGDVSAARKMTDDFMAKARIPQQNTLRPEWQERWTDHGRKQRRGPRYAAESDPQSAILELRRLCGALGMKTPKLAERRMLINGTEITLIGLKCDELPACDRRTYATHHDPGTAINMAARRMLRRMPSPDLTSNAAPAP